MLIAFCGLQGTGKSTLAAGLASSIDATLLVGDTVLRERYLSPTFAQEEVEYVYQELLDRARSILPNLVVVDAVFPCDRYRTAASDLATTEGRKFVLVYVTCDEHTVVSRLQQRLDGENQVLQYQRAKAKFEAPSNPDVLIENSGSLESVRGTLVSSIRGVCKD